MRSFIFISRAYQYTSSSFKQTKEAGILIVKPLFSSNFHNFDFSIKCNLVGKAKANILTLFHSLHRIYYILHQRLIQIAVPLKS